MTYGYGDDPGAEPPVSRGRRRAQGSDANSAWYPQSEPTDPASRRYPSPPPPASRLGRPTNSGSPPVNYPAYPPPVPTSPTVPRPTSPRPAGQPRQDPSLTGQWNPPTGGFAGGGRPAPGFPGGPGPGFPGGPPAGRGAPRGFAGPGGGPAGPGTLPRPGRPTREPAPRRPRRRGLPPLPDQAVPRSVLLRNAVPGLIRHLPHHKPWMVALSAIAIAVVLSMCGLGSYLLFKDDQKLTAAPTPTATVPTRDISTRDADKAMMTPVDVFPKTEIIADPSVPPYKEVGDAQEQVDCRAGATGELGKLLIAKGCNQIIRATFSSTDSKYFVTAGIFNMKDATSASQVVEQVKSMDPSTGRFQGYITTTPTKVLGRAATQVGWESEGHFLIYCVIARADGQDLKGDDPMIKVIVYDMVEKYLRDTVIYNWSIDKSANASSSAAPTSSASAN
jgi:hypothetical protein